MPGIAEARGVARGDREARGLLEPRAGEQHPIGEVAELRVRLRAQSRLSDDGRDQVGGVALLAQPRDGGRDIRRGLQRILLVEQPQAFRT